MKQNLKIKTIVKCMFSHDVHIVNHCIGNGGNDSNNEFVINFLYHLTCCNGLKQITDHLRSQMDMLGLPSIEFHHRKITQTGHSQIPQNDLWERFQKCFTIYVLMDNVRYMSELSKFLRTYRNTPHSSIGLDKTSAELLFHKTPHNCLPGRLISDPPTHDVEIRKQHS